MNRQMIFLLFGVFLLALALRCVLLNQFPVSLTIDEVAVSYNAYSILKTGKDEWGETLPLLFRSVGDYKSPLLIYSTIPAVFLFGMSEFSTRITIALIGSLTVLVVFYICFKLTRNKQIGLLGAFLLAISPWHINPSRITHDATLALFLVLLGVAFFIKASERKFKNLWLCAIFFSLSLYAYHAQKIFVPVLVLGLGVIYLKDLFKSKAQVLIAIVVGLISTIPIFVVSLSPIGQTRANMTFISKDFEINRFLHKPDEKLSLAQNIFDNNFLQVLNFWAKRYFDYADLNFLFTNGLRLTIPNSPDIGILYLFELPFLLFGLYLIFIKKVFLEDKYKKVMIFWILIGPVAASLANNFQHVFRSLTLIPTLQLITAVGIYYIIKRISSKFLKLAWVIGGAVVSFSLAYFCNLYLINYQYYHSEGWMDGWKEAAIYALENQDKYQEVVIDPKFGTMGPDIVGTPYLYLLFYGQIDPKEYQNDPRRKERNDSANFRNFTFRDIDWTTSPESDKEKKNVLYIGSSWVLPVQDNQILKKFYLHNGKEIIRAATVR